MFTLPNCTAVRLSLRLSLCCCFAFVCLSICPSVCLLVYLFELTILFGLRLPCRRHSYSSAAALWLEIFYLYCIACPPRIIFTPTTLPCCVNVLRILLRTQFNCNLDCLPVISVLFRSGSMAPCSAWPQHGAVVVVLTFSSIGHLCGHSSSWCFFFHIFQLSPAFTFLLLFLWPFLYVCHFFYYSPRCPSFHHTCEWNITFGSK